MTEITRRDLEQKHPYEILRSIDVNHLVMGKNGFKYLPWCDALDTLLKYYPDSTFKNEKFVVSKDGNHYETLPYLKTDQGFFVEVTVTIPFMRTESIVDSENRIRMVEVQSEVSKTELFPVLDFKNKSMTNPTTFDINKSLKRALAKCISCHGLGLYIYQGEELPLSEAEGLKEMKEELTNLLKANDKFSPQAVSAIMKMNYEQVASKIAEYTKQ